MPSSQMPKRVLQGQALCPVLFQGRCGSTAEIPAGRRRGGGGPKDGLIRNLTHRSRPESGAENFRTPHHRFLS